MKPVKAFYVAIAVYAIVLALIGGTVGYVVAHFVQKLW